MEILQALPEWSAPLLEMLAGKYGTIGQVLVAAVMGIGTFRLIMKPMAKIIVLTPWKWDDKWFAKAQGTKVYKVIAWLADYLCSLKLPKKQ